MEETDLCSGPLYYRSLRWPLSNCGLVPPHFLSHQFPEHLGERWRNSRVANCVAQLQPHKSDGRVTLLALAGDWPGDRKLLQNFE